MRVLQIIFCVLSCVCVLAVVPAGILWEWYCLFFILGAALFAMAMLLCRRATIPKEPPKPDFMNTDEENARLREQLRNSEEDQNRP